MLAAGVVALSALSLLLPYWIGSDQWAWLIWGRELRHGELDLVGNTAFKPLPVLIAAGLSELDTVGPAVWLLIARAGWLFALVAAYRVASRFAGVWAGVLAVVGLLLIPGRVNWLRLVLEGSADPMLAGLVLWAIDRHLHGKRMSALALGCLAALIRPEPWPIVAAYGLLVARSAEPRERALIGTLVAGVPVLWAFGGLLGAGDPVAAGRTARNHGLESRPSPPPGADSPSLLARHAGQVGYMVPFLAWLGAGIAVARLVVRRNATGKGSEQRAGRRDRLLLVLAAGAAAWVAIVLLGSLLGLPIALRFLIGPAAVISVVGAVGLVEAVRWVPGPRRRGLAVVALAALAVPLIAGRLADATSADSANRRVAAPKAMVDAVRSARARERLRACGNRMFVPQVKYRVAWGLGVSKSVLRRLPADETEIRRGIVVGRGAELKRPASGRARSGRLPRSWRRVGKQGGWRVYEVSCGPRSGGPA